MDKKYRDNKKPKTKSQACKKGEAKETLLAVKRVARKMYTSPTFPTSRKIK